MRRLGMTLRAIGAALGVDEKTVRKALAGLAS
jgi:DNA-binding CsgD family transcriptional regulator